MQKERCSEKHPTERKNWRGLSTRDSSEQKLEVYHQRIPELQKRLRKSKKVESSLWYPMPYRLRSCLSQINGSQKLSGSSSPYLTSPWPCTTVMHPQTRHWCSIPWISPRQRTASLLGTLTVTPQAGVTKTWLQKVKNLKIGRCKTIKTDKSAKALTFTTAILRVAKQSITRGARKDYTPKWSEELQNLNEEVSKARSKVAEDPSDDNNINLKKTAAKLTVEPNKAVRKSWQEKSESLNFDKEGSRLLRLVKALNGDHDCKGAPVAMEQDGETLTGKDSANDLLKQYQSPGQLNFNQEKITSAEEEVQRDLTTTDEKEPAHEVMRFPLTAQELDTALSKLNFKVDSRPWQSFKWYALQTWHPSKKKAPAAVQCQLEIGTHPKDVGKKQSRSPSTSLGSPKTCQKATTPLALRADCENWWRGSWTTGWFGIWRQITSLWMNRLDLGNTVQQRTKWPTFHNSLRMGSRRSNIQWQSGSTLKRGSRRSGQYSSWNYSEIMSGTTCYAGSPSSWKLKKHESACKGKGVAQVT